MRPSDTSAQSSSCATKRLFAICTAPCSGRAVKYAVTTSKSSRSASRAWSSGDTRYYPIRLVDDRALLKRYEQMARVAEGVTFLGRLGTYRYLDMDVTIAEALEIGRAALDAFRQGEALKSLYTDIAG